MPSKKNNSQLLSLVKAIRGNKYDDIPKDEGWFTTIQLAEEMRCSVGHASKLILRGQNQGKIETKKFKVERNGVARVVPHFRTK